MQIGAADSAGRNLDENFSLPRRQKLPLPHNERASRPIEYHSAHQRHDRP
jgi:hypothetical protein